VLQKNNFDQPLSNDPLKLALTFTHSILVAATLLLVAGCSTPQPPNASSESTPIEQSNQLAAVFAETETLQNCAIETLELHTELLTLLNETRASARLCGDESWPVAPALITNSQLDEAALKHSVDMTTNNFFDHTGSDGRTADSRIDDTGYSWSAIGENIAGGQTTAKSVVRDWLSSPGHCANIMQSKYTEVGLSCLRDSTTDLKWYWTAVFAKPLDN